MCIHYFGPLCSWEYGVTFNLLSFSCRHLYVQMKTVTFETGRYLKNLSQPQKQVSFHTLLFNAHCEFLADSWRAGDNTLHSSEAREQV